jgi:hypothetical protein
MSDQEISLKAGIKVEVKFGKVILTQSPPAIPAKIDHRHKQQTCEEIREFQHCIGDARTGKNWIFDALGGIYKSPRLKYCEISIDRRNYEPGETAIELLIERLSAKATLTINVALSLLAHERGESIRIDLSELAVGVHGQHCLDSQETAKSARSQVFNDIEFGSRPKIRSTRRGISHIKTTKKAVKAIEVSSDDMLYRITRRIFSEEDPSDCLAVIIEPAGIMKEYAGQGHILTYYGSIKALTELKHPNRPAGMIARSVGATLNQKWRENISYADMGDNGDAHRAVVKFENYTRRGLLLSKHAFMCELDIWEFLETQNAKRIVDHWNKAIKELRRVGIIGYYKEDGELDLSDRGWRDNWLDQPLIIRPGAEGMADALTILTTKKKRDKAIQRSRRRSAKKAESINETGNPEQ